MKLDGNLLGSATPPPFKGGQLRDYQWEGIRWMLFNLSQDRNCILADEMGLGKTIQSAGLLQMIKRLSSSSSFSSSPPAGPFLIIAPLSLIVNWQREITTWTDLDSILYYGSQEDRELIRAYEFTFLEPSSSSSSSSKKNKKKKKDGKKGYKVEVVITTPETCVALDVSPPAGGGGGGGSSSAYRYRRELSQIQWDVIIVDEAHKLKNYESKLGVTLREEYSYRNCVLLTGTPLQNNTDELWTLLNFIDRENFNDRDTFYHRFGELKTTKQLEELHQYIRPYLLRREKDLVEKTVPPKTEIIIEVELTVPQKQYYRAIYEQKTQFLYKQGAKDGPSLSNLAMELRKCCNHPFLIKGAINELSKHFVNEPMSSILVKTSGKMTLLDKLLPKLFQDQHRVLIFSQFRIMLDIIEDYLHDRHYLYDRVDGSVTGRKRQAAIDRFTNNSQVFVMLLSTRAGGVGINLTAADTVIIFDSDWNPQNDVQAQARAHRIGQTRAVTVYRLLTKKSYEMVMFKAASLKLGLDYAVMHNLKMASKKALQNVGDSGGAQAAGAGDKEGGGSDKKLKRHKRHADEKDSSGLAGISSTRAENFSALSKRELENLLKHGAYDIFLEERSGASDVASTSFVEESIEAILERSSTFLHRENDDHVECTHLAATPVTPSTPATAALGSNFAKAAFISAGKSENDVAIDDPDFWSKVVGIGVDNGDDDANALGQKRKSRSQQVDYKVPTDSLRSIYGDLTNAYVTDSDESSCEENGRKRRRKDGGGGGDEEEMDADLPVELTKENLHYLHHALITTGFGNWQQVRKLSKLRWPVEEVIRHSEMAVLYFLLISCTTLTSPPPPSTTTSATSLDNEMMVSSSITEQKEQEE
eukprot:scaffold15198_cov338-Ochromonas_danica.AAC.1